MPRVERLNGHAVVADWLGADSVVLDLGASRGRFSEAVIARFGCRVLAIEPVSALFASLPDDPRLHAERAALAAAPGPIEIGVGDSDENATTLAELRDGRTFETVDGVTLAGLVARAGAERIDLVKVDVEGAELEALEGVDPATLARIGQLTVEFHDFLVPAWRPRVDGVDRRLRSLGFHRLQVSRDRSDVLYVNAAHHPISRKGRLWLLLRYRYAWGAARVLGKRVRGAG